MPYYNRDPKRDHNFDNHPYRDNGKENGNYYNYTRVDIGVSLLSNACFGG